MGIPVTFNSQDLKTVVDFDPSLEHLAVSIEALRNVQSIAATLANLEKVMSEQMDALAQQVSQNTTVVESAIALINGFSQRLSDGIAAAQAGDLSKLTDLETELATEDQKLAQAVADNTQATTSTATSSAPSATPTDAPSAPAASDPAQPAASDPTATASASAAPSPATGS